MHKGTPKTPLTETPSRTKQDSNTPISAKKSLYTPCRRVGLSRKRTPQSYSSPRNITHVSLPVSAKNNNSINNDNLTPKPKKRRTLHEISSKNTLNTISPDSDIPIKKQKMLNTVLESNKTVQTTKEKSYTSLLSSHTSIEVEISSTPPSSKNTLNTISVDSDIATKKQRVLESNKTVESPKEKSSTSTEVEICSFPPSPNENNSKSTSKVIKNIENTPVTILSQNSQSPGNTPRRRSKSILSLKKKDNVQETVIEKKTIKLKNNMNMQPVIILEDIKQNISALHKDISDTAEETNRGTENISLDDKYASMSNDKIRDQIEAVLGRLKIKQDQLDRLKQASIYKKKHNLDDLCTVTQKIKSGCQEALQSLVSVLQENDPKCNMQTVLRNLNISTELIGYRDSQDDFE